MTYRLSAATTTEANMLDVERLICLIGSIPEEHFRACVREYLDGISKKKRGARKLLILGDKRAPRPMEDALLSLVLSVAADGMREAKRERAECPRFLRPETVRWLDADEAETRISGLREEIFADDPVVARRAEKALRGAVRVGRTTDLAFTGFAVSPTANPAACGVWGDSTFERHARAIDEADMPVCRAPRNDGAARARRSTADVADTYTGPRRRPGTLRKRGERVPVVFPAGWDAERIEAWRADH